MTSVAVAADYPVELGLRLLRPRNQSVLQPFLNPANIPDPCLGKGRKLLLGLPSKIKLSDEVSILSGQAPNRSPRPQGPAHNLQPFLDPSVEIDFLARRGRPVAPPSGVSREEPIWIHRKHYDCNPSLLDGLLYPADRLGPPTPPPDRTPLNIVPLPKLKNFTRMKICAPSSLKMDSGDITSDGQPAPLVGVKREPRGSFVDRGQCRPQDNILVSGLGDVDGVDVFRRPKQIAKREDAIKPFLQPDPGNSACAEALREEGYAGAAEVNSARRPGVFLLPRKAHPCIPPDELFGHGQPKPLEQMSPRPHELTDRAGADSNRDSVARKSLLFLGARNPGCPHPDQLDFLLKASSGRPVESDSCVATGTCDGPIGRQKKHAPFIAKPPDEPKAIGRRHFNPTINIEGLV